MNAIAHEAPPKVVRASGRLEDLVREICDSIVLGGIDADPDVMWTPHRIANLIKERYPDSGGKPSPGAITEVLQRWEEARFAEVSRGPLRFEGYTLDGRTKGLTALKAERRERLKAERAAGNAPVKKRKKKTATSEDEQGELPFNED